MLEIDGDGDGDGDGSHENGESPLVIKGWLTLPSSPRYYSVGHYASGFDSDIKQYFHQTFY